MPYPLFRAQVQAGKVTAVTAIGDAIDGEFKKPVRPSQNKDSQELERFSTHGPRFASEEKLFVMVEARDKQCIC